MLPGGGKRRARYILPGLYLLLAMYVWFDFASAPPDGLANVGLFAVTLPITLLGLAIGAISGTREFVLLPDGPGYLLSHAIYYIPAASVTALLLWWLGRAIDRRIG
jgi:hypothetical protein